MDLKAIEDSARAANQPGGDPWYNAEDLLTQGYGELLPQDRRFIAAVSPAVALALCAAILRATGAAR